MSKIRIIENGINSNAEVLEKITMNMAKGGCDHYSCGLFGSDICTTFGKGGITGGATSTGGGGNGTAVENPNPCDCVALIMPCISNFSRG